MSDTKPVCISVLVPAFNAEKYLEACLESVLTQRQCIDGAPFEVQLIVVDDQSTDGTAALIRRYAERDSRVCPVFRPNNGGEGPARNSGLDVARGDWLLCLDADDLLAPDALAALALKLEHTAADVLLYRFRMFDDASGVSWDCPDAWQTQWYPQDGFDPRDYPDHLYSSFWSSVCNKCFRLSFVREEGLHFADTPRIGDVYFTLSCLSLAHRIEFLDECLYLYRVNVGTSLTNSGDAYPRTFFRACEDLQSNLANHGLWDTYRIGFLNWLINNLPYNLATMKSVDGYSSLLDAFTSEGFERFGFDAFARTEAANPWAWDHCAALRDSTLIDGLFDFFKRRNRELEERDMRINTQNARLAELERENARLHGELAALTHSKAYRAGCMLAKPIRVIADMLRRH